VAFGKVFNRVGPPCIYNPHIGPTKPALVPNAYNPECSIKGVQGSIPLSPGDVSCVVEKFQSDYATVGSESLGRGDSS